MGNSPQTSNKKKLFNTVYCLLNVISVLGGKCNVKLKIVGMNETGAEEADRGGLCRRGGILVVSD